MCQLCTEHTNWRSAVGPFGSSASGDTTILTGLIANHTHIHSHSYKILMAENGIFFVTMYS